MTPYFDIYMVTSPPDTREAGACGCPLAHAAYSVGPGFTLLKGSIGASMRGGLMVLSDERYDGGEGDMTQMAKDTVRECVARGYQGVVFDFEGPIEAYLEAFAKEAGPALAARGLTIYVYPPYADSFPDARIILSTALVSGRLSERMNLARTRYPGHRLCVELERLSRDITLPDPSGAGVTLTARALDELTEGRNIFFSKEMAAHYFTYKDRDAQTHFVLFDDAFSVREKVRTALAAGIHEGFMLYPDVKEMWSELKTLLGTV